MKILTVSALVCALMALTTADGESDVVKRSASCARLWLDFNGRCFSYNSDERTWAESEEYCKRYGGHLASVQSVDEYSAIQNFIKKKYQTSPVAWLGGSDAKQEGNWVWSDGSEFRFSNWASRYHPGHCLTGNYREKKLDDKPCYAKYPSICAINKGNFFE